ncbi:MAG: hypothetical protein ABJD11_18635, partial [Gemmatimonadota bacterium]
PGINAQMNLTDRLIIRIPPQSERVGALEVWVEPNTATVFVGDHAHTRFGPWSQPMAEGELGRTAANDVIGFVADVLADRMVIWSSRRDSQTVEGGTYLREHDLGELGAPEAAEHFVWSGREVAPRRNG